jgi:hypothetical protein
MTELMNKDRLREIAAATAPPILRPRRLIVTLQWKTDPDTGRPVGRWVLDDEPGTSAL